MLNLSFQLLKLFAQGTLPATTIQIVAAAARQDGWGDGDEIAQRLANIGNKGLHTQNCLRDLLRIAKTIGLGDATPEPYEVEVMGVGGVPRTVGVLLPHEYVGKVVAKWGHENFRVSDSSWNGTFGIGKMLKEWGESVGIDSREALAIGLHADGVSYTTSQRVGHNKACLVASWNMVSAEQDTHRGLRHMFFTINNATCCDCGCEGSALALHCSCLAFMPGFRATCSLGPRTSMRCEPADMYRGRQPSCKHRPEVSHRWHEQY